MSQSGGNERVWSSGPVTLWRFERADGVDWQFEWCASEDSKSESRLERIVSSDSCCLVVAVRARRRFGGSVATSAGLLRSCRYAPGVTLKIGCWEIGGSTVRSLEEAVTSVAVREYIGSQRRTATLPDRVGAREKRVDNHIGALLDEIDRLQSAEIRLPSMQKALDDVRDRSDRIAAENRRLEGEAERLRERLTAAEQANHRLEEDCQRLEHFARWTRASMPAAHQDVLGERARQRGQWTEAHDKFAERLFGSIRPLLWTWRETDPLQFMKRGRRAELVVAAALLLAEIERIDRARGHAYAEGGRDE